MKIKSFPCWAATAALVLCPFSLQASTQSMTLTDLGGGQVSNVGSPSPIKVLGPAFIENRADGDVATLTPGKTLTAKAFAGGNTFKGGSISLGEVTASGFNTVDRTYDFKFTLKQDVDDPYYAKSSLALPSVFRYDPFGKEAYLLVTGCNVLFAYTSATPADPGPKVLGPDLSDTDRDALCDFGGEGLIRKARVLTRSEFNAEFPSGIQPNGTDLNDTKPGVMVIDDADPTQISTYLGDQILSVQTLNFQMVSVPVPAAFWLFGSSLLAMLGYKKITN